AELPSGTLVALAALTLRPLPRLIRAAPRQPRSRRTMNRIQRRLFRTFLKSGGDIVQETEVDRFVRCVEMSLSMLPPKVQAAVVLALAAEDAPHYNRLAAELLSRGQDSVTAPALRQRVSR